MSSSFIFTKSSGWISPSGMDGGFATRGPASFAGIFGSLPASGGFSLCDGEDHRDRLQLSDDAEARGAVRRHDVAEIDIAQAHAAVYRRTNVSVVHVHLRGVQVALIELHGAFVLIDGGLLGGELLLRDRVFLVGVLIAREIDARILERSLIARELALRLNQCRLVGPRVDDCQEIVLLDDLSFLEMDLRDRAGKMDETLNSSGRVCVCASGRSED